MTMDRLLKAASSLQIHINKVLQKDRCLHCFQLLSSRSTTKLFGRSSYLCHPANSVLSQKDLEVKWDETNLRGKRQWIKLEKKLLAFTEKLAKFARLDRKELTEIDGFIRRFHRSEKRQNREKNERENNEEPNDNDKFVFIILASIVLFYPVWKSSGDSSRLLSDDAGILDHRKISWTSFLHDLLQKGEVQEIQINKYRTDEIQRPVTVITHPGAKVNGYSAPHNRFQLSVPDVSKLEDKIRKEEQKMGIAPVDGVPITYDTGLDRITLELLAFLTLLPVVALITMRHLTKMQRKNVHKDDSDASPFGMMQKSKFVRGDYLYKSEKAIYFKDVAGLKEAKVEVMEFVDYLRNPARYRKIGAKIPHGALLLGPPGCGKTLLAKALATEAKVPFFATAGPEFVEVIGGLGASRVRDLFKKAKASSPCIIYIDEIDAVGKKRSGLGGSGVENTSEEEEHTLIQLLSEMDGFGTEENIIILGSTNRADLLDQALLRPGRFDRHIMIGLPTLEERLELFELYMAKLRLGFPISKYAPRLAQLTPGLSGADIQNICNMAAIHAASNHEEDIKALDFDYACERVITGSAKKSKVLTPFEKKVVAYYQAGIAVTSWMLKSTQALLKVSVIPRTNLELGFSQFLNDDNHLKTKEWIFDQMCVWLAGSVTEAVIFNHSSTASEKELKMVRQMAYDMILKYGMSDTVGQLAFKGADEEGQFFKKPYSKRLSSVVDEEVRATVAKANLAVKDIIERNRDKLDKVAQALQEKETLTYEDIVDLIGPPPHGDKRKDDPDKIISSALN